MAAIPKILGILTKFSVFRHFQHIFQIVFLSEFSWLFCRNLVSYLSVVSSLHSAVYLFSLCLFVQWSIFPWQKMCFPPPPFILYCYMSYLFKFIPLFSIQLLANQCQGRSWFFPSSQTHCFFFSNTFFAVFPC